MAEIKLTRAPRDWEIIHRDGDLTCIEIEGDALCDGELYLHVGLLDEEDYSPIVEWQTVKVNEDGSFRARLYAPAGGLYRLEVREAADPGVCPITAPVKAAVHHIGVGDIFLIAGQSNAAGVGKGEIYEPLDPMVHVLRDRNRWDIATHPLDFTRDRHNPWISFGHTMARKLGYPVGLVPVAFSGSLISEWLPEEDGRHYTEMLRVVRDFDITPTAVLWVQGCSEAMMAVGHTYLDSLTRVIGHFRQDLGDPELPFFMLQINRRMDYHKDSEIARTHWAKVREAQRQASHLIPRVYITDAFDARLSDGIHHAAFSSPLIGERMARQALYHLYGIGVRHDPPEICAANLTAEGNVMLSFDNLRGWQTFDVGTKLPFTLTDEGGNVEILRIWSDRTHIYLAPAKPLRGAATVTGMAYEENAYFLCDEQSQLPMLGFEGFSIS